MSSPVPEPERVLRLQGATNFRDLGGYVGHDGRRLRWRRLFRSDHLGRLTTADREALAGLGIRRIFDFRGVDERAAAPCLIEGLTQHSLAIEPTVAQHMTALAGGVPALTPERMGALMEELYCRLIDDAAGRYADWFAHLLDDDSPLVFHCTAGKDRTGVAAALLLLALGVPRAVVEQDYLLTNLHYRPPALHDIARGVPEEALAVLWSVRAGFLHAALAAVERQHGGLDLYFEKTLRLRAAERARLAAVYLEPC